MRKIFEAVKEGNIDNYIIKNGLLFKKHNEDILLVVPKTMFTQIIKQAHERGHFVVAKTEAIVLKDYWMPNIKSKVEKIV